MPSSVLLNHNDGVYTIDSAYGEGSDPEKNVLTWLVSRKSRSVWRAGVEDTVCRAHCLRSF